MKKTDLIAMREDLGLGHKGNILITTQEKVDNNLPPIATSLLGEGWATCIVNRVNQFADLLAACEELIDFIDNVVGCPNPHEDMDDPCTICRIFDEAKAAIAKATE